VHVAAGRCTAALYCLYNTVVGVHDDPMTAGEALVLLAFKVT
jgi:hypothetical protein